jgi:non-ribosomal peptide synthase protein (TIGR01720 family)
VLLTALVEAFADWTGRRALLVDLEGHGREELFAEMDVSRTVGWFTSLFPVLLDVSEASDPGEALKAVKEQLRAIPHRGIGYGILRHLGAGHDLPVPAPEVSFNYLGQLDDAVADGPFRFAREASGMAQSPTGLRPHLIDVNAVVIEGCLQLHWNFATVRHDAATIEALADGFIASLRDLIAHCHASDGGFTLSDFPLLNIEHSS